MPINRPTLPPRAGYVEVEENGQRVYKKVRVEFEDRLSKVETYKAEKSEVEAVWTELASAYTEGVNEI